MGRKGILKSAVSNRHIGCLEQIIKELLLHLYVD